MKPSKTLPALIMACMFLALQANVVQAHAANSSHAENTGSEIGFYVQPVIPENQIDPQNSYFDLRVSPGQQQTLAVEVVNQSKQEITILVSAVSVSTNANGVLDYHTPGIKDETLQIPFSDIATVLEDQLVIPANSSATARVRVEMPQTPYDGAILGGMVLEKKPVAQPAQSRTSESSSQTGGGAVVTNVYSYSVAVKLTETDTVIAPDFEMAGIRVSGERGQIQVLHSLRNPEPVIIKDMEMDVDIYRHGEDAPMARLQKTGLDMAPNTVMEMGVAPSENQLPAGTYTSYVEVRYAGDIWNFETTFVVDAAEARVLNSSVIRTEESIFPAWAVVLILLAVVIVILLVLLLIRTRKMAQDTEETPFKRKSAK